MGIKSSKNIKTKILLQKFNSKKSIDDLPKDILNYIFSYIFNKEISTFLTTDYIKCRGIQLMYLYLIFKSDNLTLLLNNLLKIYKFIKLYPEYQQDYDSNIHYKINYSNKWKFPFKTGLIKELQEKDKNKNCIVNDKKCFGIPNNTKKIYLSPIPNLQLMFNNYYLIDNGCDWLPKSNSNPILLDILFSGCNLPYANSTNQNFNDNMKNDIFKIIELFPNCLYSHFGQLRCRTCVTPIAAACFNKKVPLNIIETLVKESIKSKNTLEHTKIYFDPVIKMNGEDIDILKDLQYDEAAEGWSHNWEDINKIFNENI